MITKKVDDEIYLFILQNKLKNIIVIVINLIFIMTRDFERTLIKHSKNVIVLESYSKYDIEIMINENIKAEEI